MVLGVCSGEDVLTRTETKEEQTMSQVGLSSIEMELRSPVKRRYWSPSSQRYAPADVLLAYLADGWHLGSVVGLEKHWYGVGRQVQVCHFELTKDKRTMVMPVQCNPVVRRLLRQRQLRIVMLNDE